jgi:hypothetical protein
MLIEQLLINRRQAVNFANPFNGRRWLNLLEPHDRYGLLFKKNLRYPRDILGFSFSSNEHGLRGPGNVRAPGVILGTSFAMGLSVDNGDNWYDRLLEPSQWFNAGMPVGPRNHLNLLQSVYDGPTRTVVYIYHPNLWKTAQGYATASESGRTIFDVLNWKTSLGSALKLYPRWVGKECIKAMQGVAVHKTWDGRRFFFNASYCLMNPKDHTQLLAAEMAALNAIFGKFEKAIVVRVPIKEEVAAESGLSPRLQSLAKNYDTLWDYFAGAVDKRVQLHNLPRADFVAEDFHPYDTHWTKTGNLKFARALGEVLDRAGVGGILQNGKV